MSTLAFSSEIAMGRRPISFGHISPRSTSRERRDLTLGLFTERGASHLRARCRNATVASARGCASASRRAATCQARASSGQIQKQAKAARRALRRGRRAPLASTMAVRCAKIRRLTRYCNGATRVRASGVLLPMAGLLPLRPAAIDFPVRIDAL